MNPSDVRRIYRKTRRIEGWFSLDAAMLFGLLDEVQRRQGIEGNLFEIGVHHGKSAVLLGAIASPEERIGICDIFENQGRNMSASGTGDREVFERNYRSVHGELDRIDLFAKRSSDLRESEVAKPVRIFHVDGGHLADEAYGDIVLAARTLHERGAIVVDDPFRPEWPGVTEGVSRYMEQEHDLAPVMMGFNKLVLAKTDVRHLYSEVLRSDEVWSYVRRAVYAKKVLPLFGHDATIFYIPTRRKIAILEPTVAQARWLVTTIKARSNRLVGRA